MRPRRREAARGFTLIELMTGSAVMVVILTGAIAVLLAASSQHRRSLEKANLERACTLLVGQLEAELRQAGLGVPKGSNAAGARFPASVLVGNPNDIAFLADVARPNSSFNGISQLSDDQVAIGASGVSVLNELNGTCDVDSVAGHCRTDQSSALFGPSTDCSTNPNVPTCPWSLRKYQPQEWIVMANGAGNWLERQLTAGLHTSGASRRFLELATPRPVAFFANLPNRGFVSTPDRILYRLNAGAVERMQCWGQIGAVLTPAALATPCNGVDGTVWERRARDVAGLVFEYRDGADAVIPTPVAAGDLRRIRRVIINLALQRAVGTATVTANATASVTVRL